MGGSGQVEEMMWKDGAHAIVAGRRPREGPSAGRCDASWVRIREGDESDNSDISD
jgi:hypothetical protein